MDGADYCFSRGLTKSILRHWPFHSSDRARQSCEHPILNIPQINLELSYRVNSSPRNICFSSIHTIKLQAYSWTISSLDHTKVSHFPDSKALQLTWITLSQNVTDIFLQMDIKMSRIQRTCEIQNPKTEVVNESFKRRKLQSELLSLRPENVEFETQARGNKGLGVEWIFFWGGVAFWEGGYGLLDSSYCGEWERGITEIWV